MRRLILHLILALLIINLSTVVGFNVKPVKGEWTGTIYIRTDGSIDPPDAPIVRHVNTFTLTSTIAGSIIVQKDSIIIDGNGYTLSGTGAGNGILLHNRSDVSLRNLKIQGFEYGIYVNRSSDVKIYDSTIVDCQYGVLFMRTSFSIIKNVNASNSLSRGIWIWLESNNNTIIGCYVKNNGEWGIDVAGNSNNTIVGNTVVANYRGIWLWQTSNTRVFHNNLIGNNIQGNDYSGTFNIWDDGYPSGGNYWSDYAGNDLNRDGIGDIWYAIAADKIDHYPLMGMFSSFNTSLGYYVDVISNSTITNFKYFKSNTTIIMQVSNVTSDQTLGFIRICIPHALMNNTYQVLINGAEPYFVNYTLYDNGTHRWIYFSYQHSTLEIIIVPESPLFFILPLSTIAILSTTLVYKRKCIKSDER